MNLMWLIPSVRHDARRPLGRRNWSIIIAVAATDLVGSSLQNASVVFAGVGIATVLFSGITMFAAALRTIVFHKPHSLLHNLADDSVTCGRRWCSLVQHCRTCAGSTVHAAT